MMFEWLSLDLSTHLAQRRFRPPGLGSAIEFLGGRLKSVSAGRPSDI